MRVYELAKELKVEPRQIIRELGAMGLDIDNEMSQLAPEIAEDLRRRIASQRSEIIEERRVTSRVIRRRRKKIAPEPEPEPEPTPEATSPEPEPLPPEPQPEPPAPEPEPEPEPEPTPEPQPEVAAEAPSPEPEEQSPEPEPAPETQPSRPSKAEAKAPQPQPAPEPAPSAPKAKEPKPEKKRSRKKKKEERFEPARIISRPSTPPSPTPKPAPSIPLEVAAAPAPEKPKPRRKKGRKDDIPDDEVLLRKVGVGRRKEVLERSDLYDTPPKRTKRKGAKKAKRPEPTTPKAIKRRIKIAEAITVGELAKQMGIKATEVVARLMSMGMMVTLNQTLDAEEAAIVASEFGFEVEKVGFEEEALLKPIPDKPEDLKPRPPVVTVMGHVDHGKTTLLDYIRNSNVAEGEAGGITQKIGAYNVLLPDGQRVVFIDTPGHEAFTHMRARGAQVTDIVVLVVAADDGVMQQTVEAINHAKAAEVPIVVAVNKIDVPGADPQRVRRELAEHGLVPEEWGGDTIFVDISAKTGQGVDQLLEMLLLQAEVLELKANPDKPARGRVLEARLDKGRGPVATVLVQEGTLRKGDPFVCGVHAGRVRAMFDDRGRQVAEAGPATPVEVQGLGGMAAAGEELVVVDSDKTAKRIAAHRQRKAREAELSAKRKVGLEAIMAQMAQGEVKELKVVLKADSQGSVEAVKEALGKLGTDEVKVDVIHAAAGAITESDVMLASASDAIIVGFNVRPTGKVAEVAETEKVEVRTYDVIYELIEDITAALAGLLTPVVEEEVIGRAEVRQTFRIPKVGVIAGCFVTSGKVQRGAGARLLREGVVVTTTRIASLKRFKDDVKEVAQGYECGIGLENFSDIKVGDEIEVFVEREVTPEL